MLLVEDLYFSFICWEVVIMLLVDCNNLWVC